MLTRWISGYRRLLWSALAERKAKAISPAWRLLAAAITFVLCYIIFALFFRPKNTAANYHFVTEEGAITALSAIFMAIAAGLMISACYIARQDAGKDKVLWLVLALGLGFFALDELLGFHEYFGGLIAAAGRIIGMDSGVFRNWNDIIVVGYGFAAVPFALRFLPAVLRYPGLVERLAAAGLFFVIHTVIDSVSEPETVISGILEESAKLFSALFLALGAFSGLTGAVHFRRPAEKSD